MKAKRPTLARGGKQRGKIVWRLHVMMISTVEHGGRRISFTCSSVGDGTDEIMIVAVEGPVSDDVDSVLKDHSHVIHKAAGERQAKAWCERFAEKWRKRRDLDPCHCGLIDV